MDDKFRIYPGPISPIPPSPRVKSPTTGQQPGGGPSFEELLDARLGKPGRLQFSRHALSRMESRGIQFSGAEMNRIEKAVLAVQAKGGRDSLVLLDETALVVSVKNQTVVTIIDQESLKGNVFTNIDSAVIA